VTVEWRWQPYVELARLDQWLKNVAILPGVIVAVAFRPGLERAHAGRIALCILAACLLSSSNYVLNGILDTSTDRAHPVKRSRPLPAGRVRRGAAWSAWAALAAAGLPLAFAVNREVGWTAVVFWLMALVYNVPPLRTKDVPYADVIVESANNPLRLSLGWFTVIADRLPPISLLAAYWALGAFFLTVKRLAELRFLESRERPAAAYRRAFAHYGEEHLLAAAALHLVLCAFFTGVFVVRFKLELILILLPGALFLAYYLRLGLRPESPAQSPERVFRRPALAGYLVVCVLLFLILLHTDIPALYRWFNVEAASTRALWRLDP